MDKMAVMGRKKNDPVPADEPADKSGGVVTGTVRVPSDLAKKASMIAIARGKSVGELLEPVIRPFIEAEYAKTIAKLHDDLGKH